MSRINLIVLRTKSIKKLSNFYENLGISFEYHRHGKGPMHYSSKLGATVFEIYPLKRNQEKADESLRLGFTVSKLDELIFNLKEKGVSILKEPSISEWGYFAIVQDLDGRKIELTEVEE